MVKFPVTFNSKFVYEPFLGDQDFFITSANGYNISDDLKSKFWTTVRISDDGQRVLAVSISDIYVSNDGGTTWTRSQAANTYWDGVRDRTVTFGVGWSNDYYMGPQTWCATSSDHHYIYLRGSDGFYVSSDYGSTFTKTYNSLTGSSINSICCSSDGQNVLMAAGDLLKSTDFGQTFTIVSGTGVSGSYASASDDFSKIIFWGFGGGSYFGPYVSLDSGTTWTNYATSFGRSPFRSVSTNFDGQKVYVNTTVGPYVSLDGGVTWTKPTISGSIINSGKIQSSVSGNNVVLSLNLNYSSKLLLSTNNGQAWTNTNFNLGNLPLYINVDDTGSKIQFIDNNRFYVSDNGGSSFAQTSNFSCIAGSADGTLSNVAIVSQNSSSSNNFIRVSTNSGNTWTLKSNSIGLGIYSYFSSGGATIASDKNTGSKLFVRANNNILLYSSDFGDTWSNTNLSSYHTDPFYISDIDCDYTATNIYVACYMDYYLYNGIDFVLHSNDSGTTWTKKVLPFKQTSSVSSNMPIEISCSSDGSKVSVVSSNASVYYSSDYANTWTNATTPYKKPAGRGFVARDGSYIAIRDGTVGSSWNTTGEYYLSYDNGNSFSLASNTFQFDAKHERVGSSNGQILYIAANAFTVGFYNFSWDNSTRYANNSYVWVSNNAGISWARANSGIRDWKTVDCTPDGNTAVAASSFNGKIFKTTDRGTNWADITPSLYPNSITGWKSIGMSYNGIYMTFVADGNNYPKMTWNNFNFPWVYNQSITPGYNKPILNIKEVVGTSKDLIANGYTTGGVDWWDPGLLVGSNTVPYEIDYGNGYAGLSTYLANTTTNSYSLGTKNWVSYAVSAAVEEPPYYSKRYLFAAEANGSLYRACYGTNNSVSDLEPWTVVANAVTGNWKSITCTVTGNNAAACIGGSGGDIYVTNDKGRNWTSASKTSTANGWMKIVYSSYGSHLFAVDNGGYIWYSTDKGSTWNYNANAGVKGWTSIAVSSNTMVQIATESGLSNTGGYIWMSRDFGSTWQRQDDAGLGIWWDAATCSDGSIFSAVDAGSNKVWYNPNHFPGKGLQYKYRDGWGGTFAPYMQEMPVAISANGKYMYTWADNQTLLSSKDYGETWRAPPYTEYLGLSNRLACSGDGKIVVGHDGNNFYVSNNYGEVFAQANLSAYSPGFISTTSNGQYIITNDYYANIWKSSDYGTTWTELANSNPSGNQFRNIFISEDGSKIFLIVDGWGNYNQLMLSVDGGSTFANVAPPKSGYSNTIIDGCMSGDGSKLFALDEAYGVILVSTDNGSNWTLKNRVLNQSGSPNDGYMIISNLDGSILYWYSYGNYNEGISVSYDGGESWVMLALPPYEFNGIGGYVAMSEDGKKFIFSEEHPFNSAPYIWVYKY